MMERTMKKALLGASLAALLGFGASTASAAMLTYDLRASAANTTGANAAEVVDAHTVKATAAGQWVSLELWAVIAPGGAAAEGYQKGAGSFKSSNGGVLGNFSNAALVDPYHTSPDSLSFLGKGVDLDGDGDLDIGSNGTTAADTVLADFFTPCAASMNTFAAGQESVLLGTVKWTLSSDAAGQSSLWFAPRVKSDGMATAKKLHSVLLDGVNTAYAGDDTQNVAFTPVSVSLVGVPEPATMSVLLIGAGLLACSRNRRRA